MQGTQASCDGGESVPSDTPSSSLRTSFPPRLSLSLHLYDRFVQDNYSDVIMDSQNSMDIEEDTPNAPQGVPPSADDAVATMISLSSRPCITARDSIVSVNAKNANKRELVEDSRSTSSVKKPASIDPISSNNPPESGQGGTLLSPLPFAAPTVVSHRYNSKDQPPFVVQVQSTQESGTSHPLHISRVISQIFPRDILEIKKAGRNKVLVQTKTYEAANRLVSNNSLTSHNLRAFIPSYKVLRADIIRDVLQDLSIELLRESVSSPIKVLELHRLNRRMKTDNTTRYVPSRTVCLKFTLPRFIYLFNCRYSVYPFIPKTRICFSCFRVGHLSKARPRCLYCGEAAHDSSADCARKQSPPTCINCSGDHLATSHDCPKVLTHKMALSLAATENISFTEALRYIGSSLSSTSTSFADPRFDFHSFPSLPRHRSSRSSPHFFSPNSFSVLSNLPSSGDSSSSSKPFSSIVKHRLSDCPISTGFPPQTILPSF